MGKEEDYKTASIVLAKETNKLGASLMMNKIMAGVLTAISIAIVGGVFSTFVTSKTNASKLECLEAEFLPKRVTILENTIKIKFENIEQKINSLDDQQKTIIDMLKTVARQTRNN